jgi:hypothetical protein
MRRNFNVVGSPSLDNDPETGQDVSAAPVVLVDTSVSGVFSVTTSSASDTITVRQLATGAVEVTINADSYEIGPGLREIRIHTLGDDRDQVEVLNDLGEVRLTILAEAEDAPVGETKFDPGQAAYWNGSQLGDASEHGGGCGCSLCGMAAGQVHTFTRAPEDRPARHSGATPLEVISASPLRRPVHDPGLAFDSLASVSAAILQWDEMGRKRATDAVYAGMCDMPTSTPVAGTAATPPYARPVLAAVPNARCALVDSPNFESAEPSHSLRLTETQPLLFELVGLS